MSTHLFHIAECVGKGEQVASAVSGQLHRRSDGDVLAPSRRVAHSKVKNQPRDVWPNANCESLPRAALASWEFNVNGSVPTRRAALRIGVFYTPWTDGDPHAVSHRALFPRSRLLR